MCSTRQICVLRKGEEDKDNWATMENKRVSQQRADAPLVVE
jgi:hypothetical protein